MSDDSDYIGDDFVGFDTDNFVGISDLRGQFSICVGRLTESLEPGRVAQILKEGMREDFLSQFEDVDFDHEVQGEFVESYTVHHMGESHIVQAHFENGDLVVYVNGENVDVSYDSPTDITRVDY